MQRFYLSIHLTYKRLLKCLKCQPQAWRNIAKKTLYEQHDTMLSLVVHAIQSYNTMFLRYIHF